MGPSRPELLPELAPAVREELDRILASPEFVHADTMSKLLRFLVEKSLQGESHHLKEVIVGVQVFGRAPGYDPKLDPVVRVAAGRLRQRLLQYYTRAGRVNGIRIVIPKGGYAPEFGSGDAAAEAAPAPSPYRGRRLALAVVGLAALGGALAAILHRPGLPSREALLRDSRPFTNLAGYVYHPSFSPDGHTLAFDWSGAARDNVDIYIQRIDADTPVRMTTSADEDIWPVWSPEGDALAFIRLTDPTTFAIMRVPMPADEERVVARVPRISVTRPRLDWSADGKLFATAQWSGVSQRVVLVDAASGAIRTLTDPPPHTLGDSEPAFSPDGRMVAFRRTVTSGIEDVYVVSANGGEPQRVTHDNRGVAALIWTPDGQRLVVSSRRAGSVRQLWEFPLSGASPVRLTSPAMDAGNPAISRQGDRMVFVHSFEDKNIYALPLDGSARARRVVDSTAVDCDPSISADGQRIAFRSTRSGADEIWSVGLDGGIPRRITRMSGPVTGSPRWSPNGRRLLYDSRPTGRADIFAIDEDGGNPQRITAGTGGNSSPRWSRDGRTVYFSSDREGTAEIWRQPLDGGPAVRMTQGGGVNATESWDGKTLYFARRGPAPGIYELAMDGKAPAEGTRVIALDGAFLGHWAIGRAGIYYVERNGEVPGFPTRLMLWDPATQRAREMVALPGTPSAFDGGLAISSDEKTVLFTVLDRAGSNLVIGGR